MNKNIKDLNRMIARYNQLGEERKKLADIFMETVKTVTEQVIEISANKEEYNDFKSTLERIKERNPRKIVSEDFDKNKLIINLIESRKREV